MFAAVQSAPAICEIAVLEVIAALEADELRRFGRSGLDAVGQRAVEAVAVVVDVDFGVQYGGEGLQDVLVAECPGV